MINGYFKKELLLGIMILFLSAGVLPSISGNSDMIIYEQPEKEISNSDFNDGPSVDYWEVIEVLGSWHFDEGTGNVAYDSSSYHNDGQCLSTEWVSGHEGYDLEFNKGYDSAVFVYDDPSLDFNNLGNNEGFMIDFWMNVDQPSFIDTYVGLVSKRSYGNGGYMVALSNNQKLVFLINNVGNERYIRSNTLISYHAWHHIVAVWGKPSLYIYVDDMTKPDNSTYVGDFKIADINKWLALGNDFIDGRDPFDGIMDEIQISKIITNHPPETPIISGPTKFFPNIYKKFTFTSTDQDNDQIYYYVEWGDGSIIDWQGSFPSGTQYQASHRWSDKATFTIKCKAKDINGLESDFGIFNISTPRNKIINSNLLILLENHINIFPILKKLLNS